MIEKEWIYHFDEKGSLVRNKSVEGALPRLSSLDDNWFKYYVLAYDYIRSPYKFRPVADAKLMAARMSFGLDGLPEDEDEKVIEELKSVIYDEKHETVVNLRTKIKLLNDKLLEEDDPKELPKIMTTIDKLESMQDSILEKIKEKSEEINIGKGRSLSLIEKLKRNKKLYELEMNK